MAAVVIKDKTYEVNGLGYLIHPGEWTEDFAQGMAPSVGIPQGLTEEHWKVVRFLRQALETTGKVPTVYQACKSNKLRIKELMRLFPTGYRRGAVVLAGFSEGLYDTSRQERDEHRIKEEKVYRVSARGYLADPSDWDENFAVNKADELGIVGGLTDRHWQIIRFLRDRFHQTSVVPTVFETCEANRLEIDELEALFPSGYHRGAVKISGLRRPKSSEE